MPDKELMLSIFSFFIKIWFKKDFTKNIQNNIFTNDIYIDVM